MNPTTLQLSAATDLAVLIRFKFNGTTLHYTSWGERLTIDGDTYVPLAVNFRWTEQTGGSQDAPVYLDVPDTLYPFDLLAQRYPFHAIDCELDVVDPADPTTRVPEWWGRVAAVTARPGGIRGVSRLRINGIKSLLEVDTGIYCTSRCAHVEFGGPGCGVNRASKTYSGVIAGVNVDDRLRRVSITLDDPVPNLGDRFFQNGDVTVGGVRVRIRRSLEDGRFDLVSRADHWSIGAAAVVREGCDRTLTRCKQHGNEIRYLALGIKMTRDGTRERSG